MRNESPRYFRYFTYIKPIAKLPIVRTYGSTIFTLIVIIVFIFFAIKPTIETILILQKKLDDSNKVLGQLNQKVSTLTEAKKNYDNLNPVIKRKIYDAIPDKTTFNSLVQNIENIIKTYESSISALQIQPISLVAKDQNKIGALSQIDFTVNIEGEYPNLVSILQQMTSSSRVISIDSITMNKISEESGLIMSISGKAYYLK